MDETPTEGGEPNQPPQKTQQEIFEQQARETGQRAKKAMVTIWQDAKTISEKMLIVASILGIISFFLPWFTGSQQGVTTNASVFGFGFTASVSSVTVAISGLDFAKLGETIVWFFPIMMAIALFLSWLNLYGDAKKHILSARWIILIGAAWSWFWMNYIISSRADAGVNAGMGFGGYLAALASLLVLISGIMQVQDYLRRIPSSPDSL